MVKVDRDVEYKRVRQVVLEVSKTHVMGVSLAASKIEEKSPAPRRGASSHGNGARHQEAHSDINVTPLIDVVLVLLIIFMVLTPLAEKQKYTRVPEYQPDAQPVPPDSVPPDQTVLTVAGQRPGGPQQAGHDARRGHGEARPGLRRPPLQAALLQRRGQGDSTSWP